MNYPNGFNYGITYGANAYYNQATIQDLDTLGQHPQPVAPLNNKTYWYENTILKQVAANSLDGNNFTNTGYGFLEGEYDPAQYFGVSKLFSRLKTFVIRQELTLEMAFIRVDTAALTTDLKVEASAQLKLFGLFSLGSGQGEYQVNQLADGAGYGNIWAGQAARRHYSAHAAGGLCAGRGSLLPSQQHLS